MHVWDIFPSPTCVLTLRLLHLYLRRLEDENVPATLSRDPTLFPDLFSAAAQLLERICILDIRDKSTPVSGPGVKTAYNEP